MSTEGNDSDLEFFTPDEINYLTISAGGEIIDSTVQSNEEYHPRHNR